MQDPDGRERINRESAYRLRYTRWYDRALALVWPPKRRSLRIAQVMLDASADDIQRSADRILRDLLLYGTTYTGADGKRIDPEEIHADPA